MIQLKKIKFQYPQSTFNLEFDEILFRENSKTAIIGPSGSGKTTMLNLLAGILIPDWGDVNIENVSVNKLSEKERRGFRIQHVGFVFQDFRLIPYLNVFDNILLPFRINSALKQSTDAWQKAQNLSEELKIRKLLKKYPAKLSHGERQRVAIARALVNRPKLILADEPTGNLDPENKKHIRDILFRSVEKQNATLITVTHDHEMLEGFDSIVDFKKLRQKVRS